MPTYDQFQHDYWAPDRDAVLAAMRPAAGPGMAPGGMTPLPGFLPNAGPNSLQVGTVPPLPTNGGVVGPAPAPVTPGPRLETGGTTPAPAGGATDPRAVFSAIYRQYGLDPNRDPASLTGGLKNPLANVDYFLQRYQETGNDLPYWQGRLEKEIQLAQQGLGNRPEGGGGPGPMGIPVGHVPPLTGDLTKPSPGLPGGGGGGPSAAGGGGDDLQALVRDRLAQILQNAEQPVNEQSLGIRQPYEAASLAAQREQDQERTQLAERLYAQGSLGGNELTQGIQQSAERNAIGLGQLKSGLIANEIAAKRAKVQQGLQLANAIGARQEANALARELANLENQFRYAQLSQQGSQFGQDLGLRYAQLAQQGNQFGQELGFRQGQWGDQYGLQRQSMIDAQNRAAMLAALGM